MLVNAHLQLVMLLFILVPGVAELHRQHCQAETGYQLRRGS